MQVTCNYIILSKANGMPHACGNARFYKSPGKCRGDSLVVLRWPHSGRLSVSKVHLSQQSCQLREERRERERREGGREGGREERREGGREGIQCDAQYEILTIEKKYLYSICFVNGVCSLNHSTPALIGGEINQSQHSSGNHIKMEGRKKGRR